MATAAIENLNRAPAPVLNNPREIGLFERGVIAIKDFIVGIFQKIIDFFVRIFRRETPPAPMSTAPITTGPLAAPTGPVPTPPRVNVAAAPPATQPEPLSTPARDLLRDLRAWQEPAQLLARFERVVEEGDRNEILGRIGRARGVGNLDAGLNRFWRSQEAVDAQYVEVGRAAVRENPRILINDVTNLFPA